MDVAYSWFRRSVSKLKSTALPSSATTAVENDRIDCRNELQEHEEDKLYGITNNLIEFIKSFSLETFRNFSLPDEEGSIGDGASSGKVRKDLTDWQEKHSMIVLSRVKELAQLRFKLCPRYLKEWQFWRIYFKLVESYIVRFEAHAAQLANLKQLRTEDGSMCRPNACEVEMSEAKLISIAGADL